MDEYLELLILAYFKEQGAEYSLNSLKDKIGVPLSLLDKYLDDMINDNLLYISDENLLSLTLSGRVKLHNSDMEQYSYEDTIDSIIKIDELWPIDKPYPIHEFSRKKWRGSES